VDFKTVVVAAVYVCPNKEELLLLLLLLNCLCVAPVDDRASQC